MKFLKLFLFSFLLMQFNIIVYGQENTAMPERSPEQEAVKQTEKLQSDLQLNSDQLKQVHEINLKYARERQNSNTRSDALKRIKDKDEDLQRVLNSEQYNKLQHKRYDRSSFQSPAINSNRFENTNNQRVNSNPRTTPSSSYRTPENNNTRSSAPNTYQRKGDQPAINNSTNNRSATPRTNPSVERSGSSSNRNAYSTPPTRTETQRAAPTQRSSSSNESNRSSSSSSNSRSEGSSGSNRR